MSRFALEWEEGYVVTRMKWIVGSRVVRERSVRGYCSQQERDDYDLWPRDVELRRVKNG